jgi:hypothetical protein
LSSRPARHARAIAAATALTLIVAAVAPAVVGAAAKTKRASVKNNGAQSNGAVSFLPALSGNGRFVVFRSNATNLVSNDGNGVDDLFVRDFKKGKTRRVSLGTGGVEPDAFSTQSSISDDGRFLVFRSSATNIGGGSSNGQADIFLRDRKRKKTRLISKSNSGIPSNSASFEPKISANGRYVTYYTIGQTIVPNDTNGSQTDVLVYDRVTKKTSRVSKNSAGVQGDLNSSLPDISGDGRFVVFGSESENLVGRDNNGFKDIFIHDRKKKKTKLISMHSNGSQTNGDSSRPTVSANGRFVAFQSLASNLVGGDDNGHRDVFVHDRKTKKTKRVSISSKGVEGDIGGNTPSVSNDGRYIAFASPSKTLVNGDTNNNTDVFVRDRIKKKTKRVGLLRNGSQIPFGALNVAISGDGRFVSFTSSFNIGSQDTNNANDAFRRGPLR